MSIKKILFIYLFIREREREAETQAEGEAGSMQGARHGTLSQGLQDHIPGRRRRQTAGPSGLPLLYYILFIYEKRRERETEKQRHRRREKQAPFKEPNLGLDPGTPGSRPRLKADARPLSHPGIPNASF